LAARPISENPATIEMRTAISSMGHLRGSVPE
jgi:hypothetical protein